MAGPGFFDQFARTFNLSLRIPGTDLRVQAAVLLAVCCLSSCTPYNFREKQPFIGHLVPPSTLIPRSLFSHKSAAN
jgi:hypothetical protein